jgi:hypothetical protein
MFIIWNLFNIMSWDLVLSINILKSMINNEYFNWYYRYLFSPLLVIIAAQLPIYMHLVQIHGFCFIVEFIALILLLLYVFDYYFNIFFHILICKYISLIINLFDLKWFAYHLYCLINERLRNYPFNMRKCAITHF